MPIKKEGSVFKYSVMQINDFINKFYDDLLIIDIIDMVDTFLIIGDLLHSNF